MFRLQIGEVKVGIFGHSHTHLTRPPRLKNPKIIIFTNFSFGNFHRVRKRSKILYGRGPKKDIRQKKDRHVGIGNLA